MIFISLGTQKFQFNRLLIEVDKLIEKNDITDKVFAQIGHSSYIPKYFSYKRFLNSEEYNEHVKKSSLIITHGGTGSIISSIKKEKKVIACPRLQKFNEHVDDHQIEVVEKLSEQKLIFSCYKIEELKQVILNSNKIELDTFNSNSFKFNKELENVIDRMMKV